MDFTQLWQMREIMPIVAVDYVSGRVLMLGYMNKEAFAYTLKTGKVWYCNPENGEIRMKGENSGSIQRLVSITADSDYASLLIKVEQYGLVCHADGGHRSCYINELYSRDGIKISKHRKFGKIEVDKDFDYSKEDYSDDD